MAGVKGRSGTTTKFPDGKMRGYLFRFPASLADELAQTARQLGVSRSTVVRRATKQFCAMQSVQME